MSKYLSWIVGVVFFLSIVFLSGIHGFLGSAFLSLLLLILFLLTPLPVSRILFSSNDEALIMTFPIGFVLHGVLLSLCGKFFGINRTTLIVYFFVVAVISGITIIYQQRSKFKTSSESSTQQWQAID